MKSIIKLTRQDIDVCKVSLIQSEVYWKHVLSTGNFPTDYDENDVKDIIDVTIKTKSKIESMLLLDDWML